MCLTSKNIKASKSLNPCNISITKTGLYIAKAEDFPEGCILIFFSKLDIHVHVQYMLEYFKIDLLNRRTFAVYFFVPSIPSFYLQLTQQQTGSLNATWDS